MLLISIFLQCFFVKIPNRSILSKDISGQVSGTCADMLLIGMTIALSDPGQKHPEQKRFRTGAGMTSKVKLRYHPSYKFLDFRALFE